jgi:MYXO-CTERM domain-containing protein
MAALTLTAPAAAYCRTTTCDATSDDPKERCVDEDGDGCFDSGEYLQWKQRCISFSVHQDGLPRSGISYEQAHGAISQAFETWLTVDCENGLPSLEALPTEPVQCSKTEYNLDGPNANVWIFREDSWPYQDEGFAAADTLGLTTVTFNPDTGEIYDTDVEINAHDNAITVGDERVANDLASIVTHEAGHVLGLAHSSHADSTMFSAYLPERTSLRSLSEDDVDGICAAYPPERDTPAECDPEPRHGFSTACATSENGCACTAAGGRTARGPSAIGLLLIAALLARIRRRTNRS